MLPLSLLLSACGTAKQPQQRSDLFSLFRKAQADARSGNLNAAREKFEEVVQGASDTRVRVAAIMNMADAYYDAQAWQDAEFYYQRFLEVYPSHELAAKAHYRLGMVNVRQLREADRDQSFAQKALDSFTMVVKQHPKSEYAADAAAKITYSRNRLAQHEQYVGMFYFRQGKYRAAQLRFEYLIGRYPEFREISKTYFYLGESLIRQEKGQEIPAILTKLETGYAHTEFASLAKSHWQMNGDKVTTSYSERLFDVGSLQGIVQPFAKAGNKLLSLVGMGSGENAQPAYAAAPSAIRTDLERAAVPIQEGAPESLATPAQDHAAELRGGTPENGGKAALAASSAALSVKNASPATPQAESGRAPLLSETAASAPFAPGGSGAGGSGAAGEGTAPPRLSGSPPAAASKGSQAETSRGRRTAQAAPTERVQSLKTLDAPTVQVGFQGEMIAAPQVGPVRPAGGEERVARSVGNEAGGNAVAAAERANGTDADAGAQSGEAPSQVSEENQGGILSKTVGVFRWFGSGVKKTLGKIIP
ncbi:MAG: outer membrane protein assembly factor BamD [Candidatus Tectomicrobia bacterium]|nr:outer membrane protein assembly factor BamD [Candidatus Tectomicrobia bacterium]